MMLPRRTILGVALTAASASAARAQLTIDMTKPSFEPVPIAIVDFQGDAVGRQMAEVIRDYGEERFARAIAKQIAAARTGRSISTTRELAEIVAGAVRTREPGQDPATRTFQAIRIHINQELAQLSLALPQAVALVRPGGRLVAISFHSLEDRIVKRFLHAEANPAAALPRIPLRAEQLPQPRVRLLGRARRPSAEEIARNPRARSAVLRAAERLADPASSSFARVAEGLTPPRRS